MSTRALTALRHFAAGKSAHLHFRERFVRKKNSVTVSVTGFDILLITDEQVKNATDEFGC
jgi:hypothetical protein